MFSLTGKKALITGATGGIGGAIAKAFYEAGAGLALSGSKLEKLEAFAATLASPSPLRGEGRGEGDSPRTDNSQDAAPPPHPPTLSSFGGRRPNLLPAGEKGLIVPIACDLTDLTNVEALIKTAEEKLGGLDILVLNAGITRDNITMRMKDEEWQQVIDVNLTANFKLARAAMKGMLKQRKGRMIFITSVVGHSGNPGQANYCATKGGLTAMAKSLAHELSSRNITINCIAPGFIATSMTDALTDDQKAKINGNIPLGRMGTPEEIAAGALYLASDEAAYITGQTLHINGGLYM